MRILLITDYLPYPPISGDRIRVYNLVKRLARDHQVTLVGFWSCEADAASATHLAELCHHVEGLVLPKRPKWRRGLGMLALARRGTPFALEFLDSARLANRVERLATESSFDVVHVEPARMAPYVQCLRAAGAGLRVLGFHNIEYAQYGGIAKVGITFGERARARFHGRLMRVWEPRYAENFDLCVTVSEPDRRLLRQLNPRLRVEVVPNGVDTREYRPLGSSPTRRAILFIGNMGYAPCADGAIWFCREVLPRIRAHIPVDVWIVGSKPPAAVERLQGAGVRVTGRVEDVVPYYERAAACVVPLRAGGGTRLKILEAMALGRPVVTTSIGCEGLEVVDGHHLLIADRPERFAEQTLRVLGEKQLSARLVQAARRRVVERYDWDAIARRQLELYERPAPGPTRVARKGPRMAATEGG